MRPGRMGVLGVYSGVASAIEPDLDVANAIGSANTKAEHENIAAFYAQEAEDIDVETCHISGWRRPTRARVTCANLAFA